MNSVLNPLQPSPWIANLSCSGLQILPVTWTGLVSCFPLIPWEFVSSVQLLQISLKSEYRWVQHLASLHQSQHSMTLQIGRTVGYLVRMLFNQSMFDNIVCFAITSKPSASPTYLSVITAIMLLNNLSNTPIRIGKNVIPFDKL